MQPVIEPSVTDEEFDFYSLLGTLWGGRWILLGIVFVSSLGSIVYAFHLPEIYSSYAKLAPKASSASSNSLMGIASRMGGLAGLSGIGLGGLGANQETQLVLETLRSREFFRSYLYEEMVVPLMAGTAWNSETGALELDPEVYDEKSLLWKIDGVPSRSPPSVQKTYEVFLTNFSVSQDKTTGFVTISVRHLSPRLCKEWVNLIVQSVNHSLRSKAVLEAERSIAYLMKQRAETSLVNLDAIFAGLIEEQTKSKMLAATMADYALAFIEPPVISEQRDSPVRSNIVILGTILGGFLGVFFILARNFFREKPMLN